MRDHDREPTGGTDLDAVLKSSLPELPPEDIAAGVTPFRRAMNRVLAGMALNGITLNFWCLNYILPAIGMVLLLLGFRTLRRENRWLGGCFALIALRAAYLFPTLALNTTILPNTDPFSSLLPALSAVNLLLLFVLYFCFWRGLRAVQEKAGLPPRAGGAAALMLWYALVCLLALVEYSGWVIAGAMIAAYVLMLRSLYRLSGELDEAGYAIVAAPVKLTDRALAAGIAAALLIGCACGYLLGCSYPMEWTAAGPGEHAEVEDIKAHLLALGFPEAVLNDLSAEDIAACAGALQVVTDVADHPVNRGRTVTEYQIDDPYQLGESGYYRTTTVYDVNELRITGVAVELPGERERWMIFHHFLWTVDPGFYGTESIQLWPAYQNGEGWASGGEVSGRVLYDRDGETYTAPYYSLGTEAFTTDSIFWGKRTSADLFAAFSLPREGENHRGYLCYPIAERQDGWITDAWINYTHQLSWAQYPAVTAMEHRMAGGWNRGGAFLTIQDALQFYATEEGVELIN